MPKAFKINVNTSPSIDNVMDFSAISLNHDNCGYITKRTDYSSEVEEGATGKWRLICDTCGAEYTINKNLEHEKAILKLAILGGGAITL